jgi:hypothetical protein
MSLFKRIPPAALPQLVSDFLHLSGAITVTICATILAYAGKIPADITGAVYTGVIGYVAGRAGTVSRATPTRAGDPPPHNGMDS